VRLNISAAFVPWLALGFLGSTPGARSLSIVLMGVTQLIHFAQPDAAQATALAAGALPVLAAASQGVATAPTDTLLGQRRLE